MSAEVEICAFADRIARLEIDRRELAADIKDVKAEAKGRGYSTKLLTACVRLILLESDKRAAALADHEELDLYLGACGLISRADDAEDEPFRPDDTPSSTSPQDTGAKGVSGESPAPGPAEETAPSQEEFAGHLGIDGRPASNPGGNHAQSLLTSEVRPLAPASAVERRSGGETGGDVGAVAQVSPEEASKLRAPGAAVPEQAETDTVAPLAVSHANATPAGSLGSDAASTAVPDGSVRISGATAGERPGTLPAERQARLEAYEAARRANPKPFDPAHPLYEILLAAREGRKLGEPAEVSA